MKLGLADFVCIGTFRNRDWHVWWWLHP